MAETESRPYRALGARIRDVREAIRPRLSQRELARLVSISSGYMSQIERGVNRPEADVLRAIARQLGTDYQELAALAGWVDQPQGDFALAVNEDEATLIRWLRQATQTSSNVTVRRALNVLRAMYREDDEYFLDLAGDDKRRPAED